jgi:hypothetical protein
LNGDLYFMDPVTGSPIKLFSNHSPPGVALDLTSMVNIPKGIPLTFMYKVDKLFPGATDSTLLEPKYTGPNNKRSKYVSPISSNINNNPSFRFGNQWAVAGRVDANTLEFGFEDDTTPGSDMDFDDIVFQIDGLNLALYMRSGKRRAYIW